jgi:cytochrome b
MPRQVSRGDEALTAGQPTQRVWDLPTRLAHWLLAALILFSWWSAENRHIDWHIWSGCAILTLLIFRLLWGLVGSSTARFSQFVRGPAAVREYLRGEWAGIGHSPLGALSVLAIFLVVGIQVGLGLVSQDEDGIYAGPLSRLISSDASDRARELHETWFNVVLALAVLHVAAIAYYRLRGRKLTGPMVTGRAPTVPGTAPMRPGKWWAALLCLAAGFAVTRWIIAGAPPFGP